jgi:hypothetical protein
VKIHPILKHIAMAVVHLGTRHGRGRIRDVIRQLTEFVSVIIEGPFKVFKSKFSGFPEAFAGLSSSMGSFLARLFERIPLVDWETF